MNYLSQLSVWAINLNAAVIDSDYLLAVEFNIGIMDECFKCLTILVVGISRSSKRFDIATRISLFNSKHRTNRTHQPIGAPRLQSLSTNKSRQLLPINGKNRRDSQ